jgi:hypothetical protein
MGFYPLVRDQEIEGSILSPRPLHTVLFFDYSTGDHLVDEQVLKTCSRTILYPSLEKCYNIDKTYIVDKEAP